MGGVCYAFMLVCSRTKYVGLPLTTSGRHSGGPWGPGAVSRLSPLETAGIVSLRGQSFPRRAPLGWCHWCRAPALPPPMLSASTPLGSTFRRPGSPLHPLCRSRAVTADLGEAAFASRVVSRAAFLSPVSAPVMLRALPLCRTDCIFQRWGDRPSDPRTSVAPPVWGPVGGLGGVTGCDLRA